LGLAGLVTGGGEPEGPEVVVAHGTGADEPHGARRHPFLLGLVVALAAVNLRPAVASVGPVLPEMRADVPLSGTGAAVLTFAPVLCFGVLAGVAPRLARRLGIEPVLLAVMVAVAAGLAVRVLDGPVLLFVGTVVAGGAIAVGNVLVPLSSPAFFGPDFYRPLRCFLAFQPGVVNFLRRTISEP